MSMTDLIAATQRLNEAADAYHGKSAAIDARVNVAEAEYGALANNLAGIVRSQMLFSGTVDPDDANPTLVDGGTFTTLAQFFAAAPAGSNAACTLLAGKTYSLTSNIAVYCGAVRFLKAGVGDNPVIAFEVYETSTHNNLQCFIPQGICSWRFGGVDISLPTALSDAGKPFSSDRSFIKYVVGIPTIAGFASGRIFGGIAGEEIGILSNNGSCTGSLGLWVCELDGPITAIVNAASGVSIISKTAVTLLNGAVMTVGTTLGVDLLES